MNHHPWNQEICVHLFRSSCSLHLCCVAAPQTWRPIFPIGVRDHMWKDTAKFIYQIMLEAWDCGSISLHWNSIGLSHLHQFENFFWDILNSKFPERRQSILMDVSNAYFFPGEQSMIDWDFVNDFSSPVARATILFCRAKQMVDLL